MVYHEDSIHAFPEHDVIIPIEVLEEIDGLKKRDDTVGNAARYVNRFLDDLRQLGSLRDGVELDNGQTIRVSSESDMTLLPVGFVDKNDNKIISVAYKLSKQYDGVALISRDINIRVKCDSLGVKSENYIKEKAIINRKEAYSGVTVLDLEPVDIQEFYEEGSLYYGRNEFFPNEFLVLKGGQKSALGIFKNGAIQKLKYTSGKNFNVQGISPRNKEQTFALEMLLDKDIHMVTMSGRAGSGKTLLAIASAIQMLNEKRYEKIILSRPAQSMSKEIGFLPGPQPLDAKILTPDGWTEMGMLKVGDDVISRDGNPTRVLGIYPKGSKKVYRVTTTDGTSTECCEDHLWFTETAEEKKRKKPGRVRTTLEIMNSIKNKNGKVNHFIPRVEPVKYSKKGLPISPYVLGAILGDGSISDSISVCNKDEELINRVDREIRELNCSLMKSGDTIIYHIKSNLYNNKPARKVLITNLATNNSKIYQSIGMALKEVSINRSTLQSRCDNNSVIDGFKYEFLDCPVRWQNPVKDILENLGLSGTKAWTKFIPKDYLYTSVEDRIALLQGLMDTDGTIKKNGEASFCTTSKQLAIDIQELVRSLGGRANILTRNRIGKSKKIDNRDVVSRRVSYEFTISLPNNINPFFISRKSQYHKSAYMHRIGISKIEYVAEKQVQCILVENDEHLYVTDDFIVTHNTLQEKMMPWLQPFFDNLKQVLPNGQTYINMLIEKEIIEIGALTYIRGRSLPNTIFIVDEAQNITHNEAKAIITRMGENSKLVLIGDLEQIDAPHLDSSTCGLGSVVEKFKDFELSGHITLLKGERSPLAAHAAKIL